MTILFLTAVLPSGRRTGGEVAAQAVVDALRTAGHSVVVVGYTRPGSRPLLHADDVAVGERPIETELAGVRAAGWMARALVSGLPYSSAKYVSRAYRAAVAGVMGERSPGLVIVEPAQIGWVVPRDRWNVPYVYVAHNLEHRLYATAAASVPAGLRRALHRREARRILALERSLTAGAAQTWAVTREDAVALAELGAGERVRSFDMPASEADAADSSPEIDVALLGTWTWRANVAGLEWFFQSVLPELDHNLSIELGGAGSERAGAPDRVRVHGVVEDAFAFLQRARVVAVPVISGEGIQIKTLDAIASGRRVVASSHALRGITHPPLTVHVADDGAAFARALEAAAAAPCSASDRRVAHAWIEQRRDAFRSAVRTAVEEAVRADR
jgi:glycosyltransferase involved in cell wall biosynthesis